jgi:colanic acid/amylovoran biosynthesis glycosyltransferase
VRIAYLTNLYPAVSHSFIRREIEAVEAAGAIVHRFSVRAADPAQLPEERDQAELDKTVVLLAAGVLQMALAVLRTIVTLPGASLAALGISFGKAGLSIHDLVRSAAYFAEAAVLAMRMRALGIDHLHAHFGTNPAMVARIASRLSGIPYSFTVHGPDEFDAPGKLDLRGKISDAAFCVAISSYGRSQLMRWSLVEDWPKIEIVRCGVDASYLSQETALAVPDDARLCSVARLSGQKGIPLLIEAAARLTRMGRNFRLTLVGDGELRADVEEMIRRLELQDVVEITGWASSDKVIAHLLTSRAMVLPSFAEGLPVVIMEALALERPVIVTAIAGTPELVDEKCGWLISPGCVESLVGAMEKAIGAPSDTLAGMGQTGRQRIIEQHDSRSNGQHLYTLFRKYHEGRC